MNNEIFQKLIKPSTCSFYPEGKKLNNYSFLDWLHGYVYSRWPYLYIGVATGEHRLARLLVPIWWIIEKFLHSSKKSEGQTRNSTFADTYHGKVVPLEEA